MKHWSTDASAEADTRITALERWAVNRGWYWLANAIARWRVR